MTAQIKKPRGLNGGRKPKTEGIKRERVSIRLPLDLIAKLDQTGNRSDIIENALKSYLQI